MINASFTKEDQQAMREIALAAIGAIARKSAGSPLPLFPAPGIKVASTHRRITGMKWNAPSVSRKRESPLVSLSKVFLNFFNWGR